MILFPFLLPGNLKNRPLQKIALLDNSKLSCTAVAVLTKFLYLESDLESKSLTEKYNSK